MLKPRNQVGRSTAMPNPVAASSKEIRDPRSGCGIPSAFGNSMGYGSDYGYQYNVPMTGNSQEDRKGFNLGTFVLEMVTGAVTSGVSSAAFYGGSKALETLKGSVKGTFGDKGSKSVLSEEAFTRYMADGSQVTDVTNLPGDTGIKISRRLTTKEMAFLTQEYGVESAQVYKYGNGINGSGGQYYLYSGISDSVRVPLANDIMLINHTHPGGTAYPSGKDKELLISLQQLGSPQRSSEIIPIGKENIRFNANGLIGG